MIDLIGEAQYTIALGQIFEEPGARATDRVDGEVAVTINQPDLSDLGAHSIVYSAKDSKGNGSSIARTVIVQDVLAPVNTLNGAAVINLQYGRLFSEEGAIATDDVDESVEVTNDGAVGTLGFNPYNNSIYLAGHTAHNAVVEFAILAELWFESEPVYVVQAAVLQDYVKILNKKDVGKDTNKTNGILNYKENLLVTSEIWYDANKTNEDNLQLFSNANSLSASAHKGMLQIQSGARAAGYMSKIPEELVDILGAEYLAGWASNYSIIARFSVGPSLFLFDPQQTVDAEITVDRTIETTPLMVFPYGDGREIVPGEAWTFEKGSASPLWNPVSEVKYGFFIPDTTLFLALGNNSGIHSGVGYKITQDTGRLCGGQCSYENADIYNYFWLFDLNDMLQAAEPWDIRPISYGKWSHPYDNNGQNITIGATFDEQSDTLYISLKKAGQTGQYDKAPMIVAYKVEAKE